MQQEIRERNFDSEWKFRASRSSGPGGQNVNKIETRVELRFHIGLSQVLTEEEKSIVREKLAGRINSADELIIVSQSERSQLKNKGKAIEKFFTLLSLALIARKIRRHRRPTLSSIQKRLEEKRKQSEKKERRKPFND